MVRHLDHLEEALRLESRMDSAEFFVSRLNFLVVQVRTAHGFDNTKLTPDMYDDLFPESANMESGFLTTLFYMHESRHIY
jgi:hypothetical protein